MLLAVTESVAQVARARGHNLVLVLAGLGDPVEGVLPVLARVEQAILVGVADVEAARQDGVGLKSSAGLPGVPLSSVTVTFLRGSLPGLVTS